MPVDSASSDSVSPASSTATPPSATAAAGSKLRNLLIAVSAMVLSVLIFIGLRVQTAVPTLATLVAQAVPLETAVTNGKPTLIEFYADWCTSCQAMAPTVASVEQTYGDRVNFVMLNVDNDKWLPEILAYRVDGIPHFEFLDRQAQSIGATLGEQPLPVLAADLDALLQAQALPQSQAVGAVSTIQGDRLSTPSSGTPGQTDPRSHGAQVKAR